MKRTTKYEDIESLYDCIAARKKLLLLDACHSGEVDRDEEFKSKRSGRAPSRSERKSNQRISTFRSEDKISLSNSFELMQEHFVNLSKGNGT